MAGGRRRAGRDRQRSTGGGRPGGRDHQTMDRGRRAGGRRTAAHGRGRRPGRREWCTPGADTGAGPPALASQGPGRAAGLECDASRDPRPGVPSPHMIPPRARARAPDTGHGWPAGPMRSRGRGDGPAITRAPAPATTRAPEPTPAPGRALRSWIIHRGHAGAGVREHVQPRAMPRGRRPDLGQSTAAARRQGHAPGQRARVSRPPCHPPGYP